MIYHSLIKKTNKLGFSLLIGLGIFTSISLYANNCHSSSLKSSNSIVYSPLVGKQWVERCVEQHPEILWLANSTVRKTEEGTATLQGTYSEQLFGQKYIEFDRTIMTLHCLRLILEGSDKAYLTFTASQPQETKLSRESFNALYLQGQALLKSKWGGMSQIEIAQAMETALVLGDIGKSEVARELFKEYHITAPDHDDFYGEAIPLLKKHPELSPSFSKLSTPAKELIAKIANLAHYGHITHLEGGLNMFSKLKKSEIASKDPTALSFDLFIHTCDVAGALGHVNNQSSLVYTEQAHQAMQAMGEAITVLAQPHQHEIDAYKAYLRVRASWLGLDPNRSAERVLTRTGAMLRLFTPEEGRVLQEAMEQLPLSMRHRVTSQLDVYSQDMSGPTPTYMPAVLVNLSNNLKLGNTKKERLIHTLTMGLPFIIGVLEQHKEMLRRGEIDPHIPLNFNKMAGIAKESPALLNENFFIDPEGNVCLQNI